MGHGGDGADDLPVLLAATNLLDKASVDLQDVHVQSLHVGERRVAGPEIVESEPHTEGGQGGQGGGGAAKFADQRGLGDLQTKLGGRDAVPPDRRCDPFD